MHPGSGNNVVSYFMPAMIKNAGIDDVNKQLIINAINPIFSMIASIYGATLLDKLGRRTMLLWGLVGALVSYGRSPPYWLCAIECC
jgi:MFS family permease